MIRKNVQLIIVLVITLVIIFSNNSCEKKHAEKPLIKKLGTIDCRLAENTPIVFKGKLYRFEYISMYYEHNKTGKSYFRFIDVESGKPTPSFAVGYHLGSAIVENNIVYVFGVNTWGGSDIQLFYSNDLQTWSAQPALSLAGWGLYNNSVCKGKGKYIMAIEIGEPPEIVGKRFTMRFAESKDLQSWKILSDISVYTKERYTACPAIRFVKDYYYMLYLEEMPGPTYETHIVRSKDLAKWENSPFNPVLVHSPEDKIIANPSLTSEQQGRIAKAVNINNSDADLCEFNGKVIIYYNWGDQQTFGCLAEAIYNGTLENFLTGFFPK